MTSAEIADLRRQKYNGNDVGLHKANDELASLRGKSGCPGPPHKRNHQGRILAACCVRYRRDLGYRAIQEQLTARHRNYSYLPLTTREGVGPGGKVYIQDLITSGELERQLGKPLDPASTHVFL